SLERQSISINLVDDELEEGDETITLALENPTGPENVTLGQASSTEITIRDNDGEIPTAAWINEFHY
ncbi:MAG TPA: hypothetical protein DD671_05140, partial [Balneolaceae bacterium]|nr:hypothetical protein [Balneolaceae bacterium]